MPDNTWDVVLAGATTSAGGLGKLATLAASENVYVRCDCSDRPHENVDFLVKTTAKVDLSWYVSRTLADNVTLTLASFTEGDTIVLNGLTLTGESTAADALFASRKFSTAGGTDTLDAAELVKLINADYAVLVDGSVTAGDYVAFVTDEGSNRLIATNGTPDITVGEWDMSGNQAAELASLVLAINHSQNVTCATAVAGDTVTINGLVFTGHADTTTEANREWDIADDNAAAAALVTCINDATYGVPGVTARATGAVVFLYRDSEADSIALSSSNSTRLACVTTVGGVPGVSAVATGGTGELSITPTWTRTLTVADYAAAGGATTHITTTDVDIPGIYATAADAVVTLVPGTPASRTEGELATVIQAVASAHCTVAQVTLASLRLVDTDLDVAANNTTAGTIFTVPVNGYEYAYCGVFADGTTPALIITATKRD